MKQDYYSLEPVNRKVEDILNIKQKFGIIGNSPLLNNAIRVAAQVARTDMTVLITGESGTGKESFSKIIHTLSKRKHGNFIAVNCGAIPEGTIDSELFGHEKGAFTGATEPRKGYFEVTDGGTLFLDEIGEMPVGTQARLLRVLENGEYIRVGSSKVKKTNVRVVAATNVDLESAVQKGKFREDLYYRLNTVPIFVPPLRQRGDDIGLLFRKFASDFSEQYHVPPISLSDDARLSLLQYNFPGNVRQLKNLVEKISVLEGENRFVDKKSFQGYLPKPSRPNLPALLSNEQQNDNFSEREILYKILFDLKKDVTDLKTLVFKIMGSNSDEAKKAMAEDFFKRQHFNEKDDSASLLLNAFELEHSPSVETNVEHEQESYSYEDSSIQDITPEEDLEDLAVEESLSLEKHEKEIIIKALKKNNNRRKQAAKDLGISERTLYRKIKQYEVE